MHHVCHKILMDIERIHWSHSMGPSGNVMNSLGHWVGIKELHPHFVVRIWIDNLENLFSNK